MLHAPVFTFNIYNISSVYYISAAGGLHLHDKRAMQNIDQRGVTTVCLACDCHKRLLLRGEESGTC